MTIELVGQCSECGSFTDAAETHCPCEGAVYIRAGVGPSEKFERAADLFHRDTGMMAIGKDDRSQSHTYEERNAAWIKWRAEMGV